MNLQRLARKKKYAELESEWMSALEDEAISTPDFISVLETLIGQKEKEQAELFFMLLLTSRVERKGAQEGLDAARKGSALFPDSEELRREIANLYGKVHSELPGIETFIGLTVLNGSMPLDEAAALVDKFLAFRPGAYVFDRTIRKPGRVERFDEEKKGIAVSFGEETAAFDASSINNLELLEPDNFRALVVFDKEKLEELSENDPEELVRITLKTFKSRLAYKELKSHLSKVIGPVSWTKWWTQAKKLITLSPIINMSGNTQPLLILRSSPVRYEDSVKARFDGAKSAEDKLVTILDYFAETDSEATDEQLLKHFAAELAAYFEEHSAGKPGISLGALAVTGLINEKLAQDVQPSGQEVEQILSGTETAELLNPVENENLCKCILAYLQQALPSKWQELYEALMPGCSRALCDVIARELSKKGHGERISLAAGTIIKRPEQYANALVWLWNAACSGKFEKELGQINRVDLLMRLLSVSQSLGKVKQRKKSGDSLLSLVRGAVSARKYSLLEEVLGQADPEQVKLVKKVVERNAGLGDQMRSNILEIIKHSNPALFVKNIPPWEEDVIYTTEQGLRRKEEEFAHLVNVKMSDIAKEIGKAAELGDLSENAEFTAALEWRERLAKRAAIMQNEISSAKIISQDTGPGSSVTIGSMVQAKDLSSGKAETFVFLGPWDADPDNGIYSYRASFAKAFMGRKIGDIVVISAGKQERKLELVKISAGIGQDPKPLR